MVGTMNFQAQRTLSGAPTSVPGITAPASCWLRVPADRIGRKISHQAEKKTTTASNTPLGEP